MHNGSSKTGDDSCKKDIDRTMEEFAVAPMAPGRGEWVLVFLARYKRLGGTIQSSEICPVGPVGILLKASLLRLQFILKLSFMQLVRGLFA